WPSVHRYSIVTFWRSMKPPSARPWRNPAKRCVVSSGDLLLRYPITGIAGGCARAVSGHAAAAPPSSVMKSRRAIIRSPRRRGRALRAERVGGLEVDDQHVSGRERDGGVGGLLALKKGVDVPRREPILIDQVRSVRNQPARSREIPIGI